MEENREVMNCEHYFYTIKLGEEAPISNSKVQLSLLVEKSRRIS
jgi:hypothetical protein